MEQEELDAKKRNREQWLAALLKTLIDFAYAGATIWVALIIYLS